MIDPFDPKWKPLMPPTATTRFLPVILESPYKADRYEVRVNVAYAQFCVRDCLARGEAPFASHLIYTQALDDTLPVERQMGIEAGFAWAPLAKKSVIYTDIGVSSGMQKGIANALMYGLPVEYRTLPYAQLMMFERQNLGPR